MREQSDQLRKEIVAKICEGYAASHNSSEITTEIKRQETL